MPQHFQNHFGLFVREEALCALRFVGDDIFKRPQFAVDGTFLESWEGHAPWDRRSVLVFDVWGFCEASDGALDCGYTYDNEPLEFQRTLIKNRIFSGRAGDLAIQRACADLYLRHLEASGLLSLVDATHGIVQDTLSNFESIVRPDVQAIFDRLGFVARKSVLAGC